MTTSSLSVIMCNYNHAHYIGEALQAILDQSSRPTEAIVVDDGSTDDSVSIIEQFAKGDPIVHFVCNDGNRGVEFSANRALGIASGDYVYFASADDKVLPGFFEKSMGLLARYPQAGLCFSDPARLDDSSGIVSATRLQLSDEPCYFSPAELVELLRQKYFMIAGHASVVKRCAIVEAGGMIPELRWHCDWFVYRVVAFRHGICYIPEPLAAYRRSPNSYGTTGVRQWPLQREVLNHMFQLLRSPTYRDVLPLFKRSSVLAGLIDWHCPKGKVRVVLSNPKHWDHFFALACLLLWRQVRRWLVLVTLSPLRRLYRRIFKFIALR